MGTLEKWILSPGLGALYLAAAAYLICEHVGMSRNRSSVVMILVMMGAWALGAPQSRPFLGLFD
jgi:hypothetical protein